MRRDVQLRALRKGLVCLWSGALTVTSVESVKLPEERLDIWEDPVAPPEYLPQSRLQPRASPWLAAVGGHIWLAGGFGVFELWDNDVPMRCAEIWEFEKSEWRLIGAMTENSLAKNSLRFDDRDAILLPSQIDPRPHSGDGLLLIFGMSTDGGSSMHTFDTISGIHLAPALTSFAMADVFLEPQWRKWMVTGRPPCDRDCHATTLIRIPDPSRRVTGLLVVFGGVVSTCGPNRTLGDSHVLEIPWDINSGQFSWAPMLFECESSPAPRYGHSLTRIGTTTALLFGGRSSPNRPLSDIWKLDQYIPNANRGGLSELHYQRAACLYRRWRWQRIANTTGRPPCARSSHRAVAVGCHLLIFGGFSNKKYLDDMYSFSVGTCTWMRVNFDVPIPSAPPPKNSRKRKPAPIGQFLMPRMEHGMCMTSSGHDVGVLLGGGVVRFTDDVKDVRITDFSEDIVKLWLMPRTCH